MWGRLAANCPRGKGAEDFQGLLRRSGRRRLTFLLSCIFAPVHSGRGASPGLRLIGRTFRRQCSFCADKKALYRHVATFFRFTHTPQGWGAPAASRAAAEPAARAREGRAGRGRAPLRAAISVTGSNFALVRRVCVREQTGGSIGAGCAVVARLDGDES
jgi:hypothetical protein